MTSQSGNNGVRLTYPAPHIAEIRLNAPERLNAVDEVSFGAIMAALNTIERNGDLRVVLLSGEGRAFCAGANYKRHVSGDRSASEREAYLDVLLNGCARLSTFPIPVIAVVQGYAVGIGLEMALNCDMIVASDDAQLGFPEIGIATFVGGGVTRILPRLVGLSRAKRMVMLGERVSGEEAVAIGLATLCVPAAELRKAALDCATRLSRQAPVSVGFAKCLLNRDSDLAEARKAERQAVLSCMKTEDWYEGVRSFAEKRSPAFVGR